MRLVILGLPGSGKGTQSKRISQRWDIPQISTGDILRQAAKEGTQLGKKARCYMDQGLLVPDALMAELVLERLGGGDCQRGFILDGFPRTIAQAEILDALLSQKDLTIDAVLKLQISDATVIRRLSQRRLCSRCASDYNLESNPPKQQGLCDRCGGTLYQREDDREETISRRLQVYHNQTQLLEDYYRDKGLLQVFDAEINVAELSGAINIALQSMAIAELAEGLTSKDDSP
jgi:adenylate kinase